ncbi:MAG TPA: error-prone DNA polymerase [Acidimicrobiia bacterium]|nr:error-prone DNA polymerase [Acidimicrobiia bacterium]
MRSRPRAERADRPEGAGTTGPSAGRNRSGRAHVYAELHCHTNFSFLDGASHPEELVDEAVRLGLAGLAVTDHDGCYGVVRFAEAARAAGLPTVFGAELTLGRSAGAASVPEADPPGEHLVVLADGVEGYARLARAVSAGQMAGEKGAPRFTLAGLAEGARAGVHVNGNRAGATNDSWFVLTGCRKGAVPRALMADGPSAARQELDRLIAAFGRERVLVELWDHGDPLDRHRNDALAQVAMRAGVEVVATNNVHYATPKQRPLATALAAVRARRSLDELDGWLPAAGFAHLRSPGEQARRFARWPGAVQRSVEVARECAFDLRLAAPELPDLEVPEGHTDMSWLRELTRRGAEVRYPASHPQHEQAQRQMAYELDVIEQLNFPGYFLVLVDIVEHCRRSDIYCQGRGSAANSAVCYALGVTKADAVALGLLFERFLSPERDGPPDIDLDIEHERREEVIQHVYEKYGRDRAAQVANVITYRPRSAMREMAKVAGLSPGQADALSKRIDGWGREPSALQGVRDSGTAVPDLVLDLATQVLDYPRHLGIHSGGMVMADRPLVEFAPVEWARMEGRSVLQWDKDDCAAAGLVKFDLLGLGMLTMLHLAVDLVREHEGIDIDLATIPQEDEVYDLLCAADTIGVFQVESRAQMATLPRLRPRTFYDLVIEVALIRPGPIQGGSVHPYLRRRTGEEPVTYPHPVLEPCLRKTLGVPLFQEQLMQIAIDAAGFSPGEADRLRQAMGSKRSKARMAAMRERLLAGMAERGIVGDTAEEIATKLEAFAHFGFPESHSVSFAYLVYSSAWVKYHHPDAFACALLNAQPMGFYSPHTITRDAIRHGVEVLGPCVQASRRDCTLEPRSREAGPIGVPQPGWHAAPSTHAMRVGLRYVRGLSSALLDRIDATRDSPVEGGGPFTDLEDFTRRTHAPVDALEALATAGAFACFGVGRRDALWAAGALGEVRPGRLPGVVTGVEAPRLPGMDPIEETAADLWSTGLSAGAHPTEFAREWLATRGAVTAVGLRDLPHRTIVEVGGVVTHRQQPETAHGVVFLNLEDETGLVNVICTPDVWRQFRRVARESPALCVRGLLERHQGVVNLVARRIEALDLRPASLLRSRDFR